MSEELKYHPIRDPNSGMVQAVSPIPADWEVTEASDSPVYIAGPDGIKVYRTETAQFSYSDDPFMQQTIVQTGNRLAPVLTLEQILEQQVRPAAEAQGYRFTERYPIPEIEGFWQRFLAAMVQTGTRRQVRGLGTEWTDGQGTRAFISIVQAVFQDPQSVRWTLQTTVLEAPNDRFEEATADYLYALGNTEINPQWQQMMNGSLVGQMRANEAFHQQMMEQSRAAHRQRMAAIEAQGAAARSVGQTYSDILDINHAGYLSRSDMNSSGHSAAIDAIGERTLIGNHETGEHYTVPSGSKYYWVSNDGSYLGTDNALYDPRTDSRINDLEWTKFVAER